MTISGSEKDLTLVCRPVGLIMLGHSYLPVAGLVKAVGRQGELRLLMWAWQPNR